MNAKIHSNLQIHSSTMKNLHWNANQIWNNKFGVNLIILNLNYPVLQEKFVQIECSHELWSTQLYFTFLWKVSLHDLWSLLPHLTHESLVFFLHRTHLPCFFASRKWLPKDPPEGERGVNLNFLPRQTIFTWIGITHAKFHQNRLITYKGPPWGGATPPQGVLWGNLKFWQR